MITVRLPSMLRGSGPAELTILQPVRSIAELVEVLDVEVPGLAEKLDDSIYNFAVNDAILLHRARETRLEDGDVVEIVPAIAGG